MYHRSGFSLNRELQRKKYEPTTTERVAPGLGVTARGFCLLGWTQNTPKEDSNKNNPKEGWTQTNPKEGSNKNTSSGLLNNKKGSKKGAKNKDKVACRQNTSSERKIRK